MIFFKHFFRISILLSVAWGMFLMAAQDTAAMPNFARKYKTSCVTCHASYPVLNAAGDAFRLNGYRFKDDEQYAKQEPLELGDEAYKKLWPKAMWPSHIPYNAGFSAGARMLAEVDIGHVNDKRASDISFMLPHEMELSWAGALGEGFAAYGDMIFVQEGFGGSETQSWLMAKSWVELSDLLGPENWINLRLGTVGMHTIGLYTAKDEQRLGIQGYQLNTFMMPWAEPDQYDPLIEFRGNSYVNMPQLGIEISGFSERWLYYLGVVNGNIQQPFGGKPDKFDYEGVYFVGSGKNLGTKDFYGGLAYKVGGLGFNGASAKNDDNPLANNAQYWRDDSITFSVFGYRGTAHIEVDQYDNNTFTDHTRTTSEDDFYRLAIGVRGQYKDLTLNSGYLWGRDDNPFGVLWENEIDVNAWFVEAFYFIYPWLIPYARYESLTYDNMPSLIWPAADVSIEAMTFGVKAHLRANIHLTAEYQDHDDPTLSSFSDEVLFLQLMFAF